jgi:drug/metabolite transporter (DMT)-like permease
MRITSVAARESALVPFKNNRTRVFNIRLLTVDELLVNGFMSQSFLLDLMVLACIFCWGLRGVVDKRALELVPYSALLLAEYGVYLPSAAGAYFMLNAGPHWFLSNEVLMWSAAGALAQFAAVLFYLVAMSGLEASFVIGLTAAYPLIMQVLAVPTLGESLLGARLIGTVLIGIGIVSIAGSQDWKKTPLSGRKRMIALACVFLCTVLWGVIGILDKKAVAGSSPMIAFYAKSVCNVFLLGAAIAWYAARRALPSFTSKALWQFSSISAVLMVIGNLAYVQALAMAPASYVIVITGCYPVVMYLAALWILKERVNVVRISGVCTIVIGAIVTELTRSM